MNKAREERRQHYRDQYYGYLLHNGWGLAARGSKLRYEGKKLIGLSSISDRVMLEAQGHLLSLLVDAVGGIYAHLGVAGPGGVEAYIEGKEAEYEASEKERKEKKAEKRRTVTA